MEKLQNCSQNGRVDLLELLARVDNDRELLRDLVTIFKEDFPRHLLALQDAVAPWLASLSQYATLDRVSPDRRSDTLPQSLS